MKPRLFADIIGYQGEVSEPNGPRVVGYFLDDYAKRAQSRFEKWLDDHTAELTAHRDSAESAVQRVIDLHRPYTVGSYKPGHVQRFCNECGSAYPCDTIQALEGTRL